MKNIERNLKRRLSRRGPYEIKHSYIGWWIDGFCGYAVTDKHATCVSALKKALSKIDVAKKSEVKPSWWYGE